MQFLDKSSCLVRNQSPFRFPVSGRPEASHCTRFRTISKKYLSLIVLTSLENDECIGSVLSLELLGTKLTPLLRRSVIDASTQRQERLKNCLLGKWRFFSRRGVQHRFSLSPSLLTSKCFRKGIQDFPSPVDLWGVGEFCLAEDAGNNFCADVCLLGNLMYKLKWIPPELLEEVSKCLFEILISLNEFCTC